MAGATLGAASWLRGADSAKPSNAIRLNTRVGVKLIRYAGAKGTSAEKLTSFLAALATMKPVGTYWFIDHPGLDTPDRSTRWRDCVKTLRR